MGETYYEVLGVDPNATVDEIESAYRERVLETHPDHSDDPDAAERFKRVTTAKSVLTDETERTRYDRLGHGSYVGLAQGGDGDDSSHEANEVDRSASTTRTRRETTAAGAKTATDTETAGATTDRSRTAAGDRRRERGAGWTQTGTNHTDRTDRTGSHHARQRSRRQHQRAQQQAAGNWPFDGESGGKNERGESTRTGTSPTEAQSDEGVQYAVHDWDDEVDLEWEGPPIDRRTVASVGLIALVYPVLVAASLTPLFSLSVNAVVAACTLALVGYLLTMPRLATAAFGSWSVGFPVGMVTIPRLEPISVVGLLAIGFAWVPFGYAVVLWWVLRP